MKFTRYVNSIARCCPPQPPGGLMPEISHRWETCADGTPVIKISKTIVINF